MRTAIDGALRQRLLERQTNGATWPCSYDAAQSVMFQVPSGVSIGEQQTVVTPVPPMKQGLLFAEADLRPNEIQDLADLIPEISAVAVKHKLRFHLRVELEGNSGEADGVAAKITELLKGVNGDLGLK